MVVNLGDGRPSDRKTGVISFIPFLGIVVAIHIVLALIDNTLLDGELVAVPLFSDALWSLRLVDLLLALALFALLIDIIKSTRTSRATALNHVVTMAVFVVCLLCFLLLPATGTSSFFVLTVISLVNVVAGFTVSLSAARRDIAID